ncbi:DNA-binding PadR family transcriptional regulator [Kribbella orskensis]|uniref:DNA-binding PadR family transcriptional regulator n=1 Tax=Kribbella orskensis TaxID=2512216 RepID=A0ABY2B6R9_9ACTN|nr:MULTISPECIES: PadR family transcriptional regulator [Kribbella]TCN29273.1 DNA-binding PadR family transcriptional regulator [Kribbella sp. VKM Ac-2500]TCO09542.1 DNA-binding PadR family transcriptional regulator [Kribbella orskensis]
MSVVRNATQAALLGLLHDGPMSGWDLVAAAQQRIGQFWTLTQSQVYRELARMAEDGLVDVGVTGARDRKPYAITDAGRAAFATWVTADPAPEQVRVPLLLLIQFADHIPAERLREIIAEQRGRHAERLAQYRANEKVLAEMPGAARRLATLRYGIGHEQAVLAWFDELPFLLGVDIPL